VSLHSAHRGIALVATLLAVVLIMTLLAIMVNVQTIRLRQATQELHSCQALAAADAGAAWVRALLNEHVGRISPTLTDLANAHSTFSFAIDANTRANVQVSTQMPAASAQTDHVDINLQENPLIDETPMQIVATATVEAGGQTVATRTVTTLLRTFQNEPPYSEIVGVVDDAGPDSIDSPGDPAGQVGGAYATDLRIFSYTQSGSNPPVATSKFETDSWFDGNAPVSGFLP
jgi:hypothetical protein